MASLEIGGPSRNKKSWNKCESTGLADIVWACFLHDYDVEDDYEISVISEEETISNNGDSENKEISDAQFTKRKENDKEAKLKKSLLIASLKRSTELLAYSEKLDVVRSPVPIDEKSHQGEENNRDTNLDLDERDNYYLRDGLGIDHGGYDGDFEIQRDGPPTMIFVTRQDDQIKDDESRLTCNDYYRQQTIVEDVKTAVNKTEDFVSLNKNAATSRMSSRRGIVRDSGNCTVPTSSSMYSAAEGYKNDLLTLEERTQAELKEIERKKLLRRISLLRIRAAKARLVKYDDNY